MYFKKEERIKATDEKLEERVILHSGCIIAAKKGSRIYYSE